MGSPILGHSPTIGIGLLLALSRTLYADHLFRILFYTSSVGVLSKAILIS